MPPFFEREERQAMHDMQDYVVSEFIEDYEDEIWRAPT